MQSDNQKTTEQPRQDVQSDQPKNGSPNDRSNSSKKKVALPAIGVILLSFIAGILGSWVALSSGIVQPDVTQTITQNRDKLVLQEGEIVADVAEQVSPSVVSVVTESVNSTFGQSFSVEGAGTGIIISSNGYVITNKHVIPENASSVTVVRSDGTVHESVLVVGRDPLNDIAFLKIDNVSDLPAAKLADSNDVQIGQQVVAIGNALGQFQNTVTSGIISGIGRPIVAGAGADSERLEDLFQTDAAINPGNSGGPLVNLGGEVIGINTAIAAEAEGIGFAIPINATKGLIKSVTTQGKVARAYIGVRYVPIDAELAEDENLPVKQGAYISSGSNQDPVANGGPADKAGIRSRDIITKVNGESIDNRSSLASLLGQYTPGDTVKLTVLRDNKQQEISVKLEEIKR